MLPFCPCVCLDYTNWLIVSNCSSQLTTDQRNRAWTGYKDVKNTGKNIEILFPKSEENDELIIPDVSRAYIETSKNRSPITDRLTTLSPIKRDVLGGNFEFPFPNQGKQERSSLTKEDIDLIDQVDQVTALKRLLKLQKTKKYNQRRQSINCHQGIRILNRDRSGLLDMSNGYLSQKYLKKYLTSWNFNIFRLNRFTGGKGTLIELGMEIFRNHNFINHFQFDYNCVRKFLYSIQSVYHDFNPYHNSLHSADVAQSMNCFLSDYKIKSISDPLDILTCIIAALCHDADHPGTNQLYLERIDHFFVSMYNQGSVLENHHLRVTMSLLHQSTLLNFLSDDDWRALYTMLGNLILATDISHQKCYLDKFIKMHREKTFETPSASKYSLEDKTLVYQMALKCSDISNPCRTWSVSLGWANLIGEEFFLQGHIENSLGLPVMSTHDRMTGSKANIQLGFIRFVVRPLVSQWNCFLQSDLSLTLVRHADQNQSRWELYKQKQKSISGRILQSPSSIPPQSSLATLNEETTLTETLTVKPANFQRRLSLPDNVPKTCKTSMISFAKSSLHARLGSMPQHPRTSSNTVPEICRRRGSLPLNVRAIPIRSAWQDTENSPRNGSNKENHIVNESCRRRRGSAPLIDSGQCGQDHVTSREPSFLEVGLIERVVDDFCPWSV